VSVTLLWRQNSNNVLKLNLAKRRIGKFKNDFLCETSFREYPPDYYLVYLHVISFDFDSGVRIPVTLLFGLNAHAWFEAFYQKRIKSKFRSIEKLKSTVRYL